MNDRSGRVREGWRFAALGARRLIGGPMVRALFFFVLVASLLPAAGIVVGGSVLEGLQAQEAAGLEKMPLWSEDCFSIDMLEQDWGPRACLDYRYAFAMYYLGLALAVASALSLVFVSLAAAWTRRDPFRMARCFGWVSGIFLTVWALLSIPRFLIAVGLANVAQRWMENVSTSDALAILAYFAIFVPAGIIALLQLGVLVRYWRRPGPAQSLGCAVDRTEAPELYDFVDNIGRKLGIAAPAWLAVTADADFSVTDGPVHLPDRDKPLEGGVMFLSLPLLRTLTGEEVAGIVAHELGHLGDPVSRAKTEWGAPYGALVSEMDVDTVWMLSINWYLGIVPALFEGAAAETMRRGEANADAATLRIARPTAAAQAFLKAVVMEEANDGQADSNFERLQKGVMIDNLSLEAAEATAAALAAIDPGELVAKIREEYQGDPTEPSIEQRIENLGIVLTDAAEALARQAGQGEAAARLGDLTPLEERATRIVHRFQQVLADEPGPLPPGEVESMAAFLDG